MCVCVCMYACIHNRPVGSIFEVQRPLKKHFTRCGHELCTENGVFTQRSVKIAYRLILTDSLNEINLNKEM